MYFNPQVKENKADYFNYELLQNELKEAIGNKMIPLIVVHGLRRTGKTSLIKVVLNTLKRKHVWIDGREIESRDDFRVKLADEINKIRRFVFEKISLKGLEMKLGFSKQGLDYLNQRKIALVIDEVQLLQRIGFDNTIAYIYDNFPNIKIILSGSEAGVLMNFLGKENAKAPLYGRAIYEIQTHRLERENSYLFLRQGAKQAKVDLKDEEIKEAVARLDGIIGWLTKYGWRRLELRHKQALAKTIDEGKYIAREEFSKFAVKSEAKYTRIIRSLKDGANWTEIKKKLKTSDKQLAMMLKRLINYGFVEKKDRVYMIADPLLEAAY